MGRRFTYREPYDQDQEELMGEAAATYNENVSLTEQHHKDEVDLNIVLARMGVTDGSIPPEIALNERFYGDFTEPLDLRSALDAVNRAKEQFAMLPAALRRRFHNNPAELYEFVSDRDNTEEAVKLGLLTKTEEKTPPAETPPDEEKVVSPST